MQFFGKTNIDFVSSRGFWIIFSISIIVIGLVLAFVFPPKFGIDYTGGTEIALGFSKNIQTSQVRNSIEKLATKTQKLNHMAKQINF
jgi:preprotein translocase subunit SecF